jgi:hypothetical protein
MRIKKVLILILTWILICSCAYIVVPEEDTTPISSVSSGWSALVTNVGKTDAGDLHIDIAIENETGDWSSMQATANKPAVLTTSDGKTTNCENVFVSTGGTSLAPGFRMRGYTGGTKMAPKTQLLYVECKGVASAVGAKLSLEYSYLTGDFNYYVASKATTTNLELNLDQVAKDVKYPLAKQVKDLILKQDAKIVAINNCTLTLTGVKRTDQGFQFDWLNSNPGDYPTYVHVGTPPVIGADGIIYGYYESPNLADTPITLPGKTSEWSTKVSVPKEATGLYILLSVESKQQKLFVSHVMDITNQ